MAREGKTADELESIIVKIGVDQDVERHRIHSKIQSLIDRLSAEESTPEPWIGEVLTSTEPGER